MLFSDTFLFSGLTGEEKSALIPRLSYEIKAFRSGEVLTAAGKNSGRLGVLLCGKCSIFRCQKNGRRILLNELSAGGAFGLIGVVSEAPTFPTEVRAKRDTKVAFIDKADFSVLLSDTKVAMNLLRFSVEKAALLNEKIAELTSNDVTQKLARYLLTVAKKSDNLPIPFSPVTAARTLSCGRASLYRAMETLKGENIVSYTDNTVSILDLNKLEGFCL